MSWPLAIKDASLKPYHTFGIDVKANMLIRLETNEDISFIQNQYENLDRPIYYMGGGANTLFTKDFEGTVIINELKSIELLREDEESIMIQVSAGTIWDDFVRFCVENGYYGIENLSAIPGRVGGAVIQNIGAYGVELKDTLEYVIYSRNDNDDTCLIDNAECQFGYRDSVFKHELNGVLIEYAAFRLSKTGKLTLSYGGITAELEKADITNPDIWEVSEVIRKIRAAKLPDPAEYGNAGSFFKNPVITMEHFHKLKEQYPEIVAYPAGDRHMKIAAGWMIDHLGWKGKNHKGAAVHEKQALVLINKNNAKGTDIVELAEMIQADVKKNFGIELIPEVNIL